MSLAERFPHRRGEPSGSKIWPCCLGLVPYVQYTCERGMRVYTATCAMSACIYIYIYMCVCVINLDGNLRHLKHVNICMYMRITTMLCYTCYNCTCVYGKGTMCLHACHDISPQSTYYMLHSYIFPITSQLSIYSTPFQNPRAHMITVKCMG